MKQIKLLIFTIIFTSFVSCERGKDCVAFATFEINGRCYTVTGGGVSYNEHFDYEDGNFCRVFVSYYLMDGAYFGGEMTGTNDVLLGFEFNDSTFGVKTEFDINSMTGFYLRKDNKIYHAYYGSMTLIKKGEFNHNRKSYDHPEVEISGKFEFAMRHIYNQDDTLLITNGTYKYNYVSYMRVDRYGGNTITNN